MTGQWTVPAGVRTPPPVLPVEGTLPSFAGATQWLNGPPLTPEELRGKVVVVNFWTYTCINWLRQLPYVRAWSQKYAGHGLVVVGVHTPEFGFEGDPANVSRAVEAMNIHYPVAVDSNYTVWDAFANYAWPALYIVDAQGRIRRRHLGEGEYQETETAIQALLTDAGASGFDPAPVAIEGQGAEAPADWASLRTAETYVGYQRTVNFASPGGLVASRRHAYAVPEKLRLDHWAVSGAWSLMPQAAVAEAAGGRIAYRFRARDVHLVMAPAASGAPVRFQVTLDGQPPGAAAGIDVDAEGLGTLTEPRLYQLIRQPGPIGDRTFEITFLDAGAEAYAFTFG
jgi:thiol-disulfide isomerase/thioredoxin